MFHDLDAQRVLYACEGRKARGVAQFADAFEAHGACAGNSCAVCMDMSASYQAGVCEHLPWAAITFDEFHVIQLVNRAIDAVRRQEVKRALELRRTRYIWLKDKHAWSNCQKAGLRNSSAKTPRHTVASGSRRRYASSSTALRARRRLSRSSTDGTAGRAVCRPEPIKAVAKTLKKYWPGLLNAFDSRLTNGRVEAVTSLIQAAKARARGYGTTRHLITILYLVAGKLTRLPTSPFVVKSGLPITT